MSQKTTKMRVFVAGKSGQVAQALLEAGTARGYEVACFGRPQLDLSVPETIFNVVEAFGPDVIINAAAYTAVDAAESDEDAAFAVNATAASMLAAAAKKLGVPFLHLSTDYVFDGRKRGAYVETDATAPQGAYGRSKLAGETQVFAANSDALVFRTSWVYGPVGKNFVKTMLTLAQTRPELGVVADQVGNPTYAPDIATALLDVAVQAMNEGPKSFAGLYHLAGTGATSWYGFAAEIFNQGAHFGHPRPKLNQLTTTDYPTPAKRPANSQLDCSKLTEIFGIVLPDWQSSLEKCVARLFTEGPFTATNKGVS